MLCMYVNLCGLLVLLLVHGLAFNLLLCNQQLSSSHLTTRVNVSPYFGDNCLYYQLLFLFLILMLITELLISSQYIYIYFIPVFGLDFTGCCVYFFDCLDFLSDFSQIGANLLGTQMLKRKKFNPLDLKHQFSAGLNYLSFQNQLFVNGEQVIFVHITVNAFAPTSQTLYK